MFVQLTITHREVLQEFLERGISKARIAKALGVSRSTVYRELERNTLPNQPYNARLAHFRANARKRTHQHKGGEQTSRFRNPLPRQADLYVRMNKQRQSGLKAKKRWSLWLKSYNRNRWKVRKDTFRLFPSRRLGRINQMPGLVTSLSTFRIRQMFVRFPLIGQKVGFRFSSFSLSGKDQQSAQFPYSLHSNGLPVPKREKERVASFCQLLSSGNRAFHFLRCSHWAALRASFKLGVQYCRSDQGKIAPGISAYRFF